MVRMAPARISRLHVVELSGRLNPLGQNLDIVELASVYGKRKAYCSLALSILKPTHSLLNGDNPAL